VKQLEREQMIEYITEYDNYTKNVVKKVKCISIILIFSFWIRILAYFVGIASFNVRCIINIKKIADRKRGKRLVQVNVWIINDFLIWIVINLRGENYLRSK
jgi:hypothetical protein